MIDTDDLHTESVLYPWLDSDCMADPGLEPDFFDDLNAFEDEEDID